MGAARGGGRFVVPVASTVSGRPAGVWQQSRRYHPADGGLAWHILHPPAADVALPQAAGELQLDV